MNKYLLFFISILLLHHSKSQDSQFNNVNQSQVYLNPSYAGSEECVRMQIDYRNQWPNLSGTYVPRTISVDGFLKPIKGGLALNYIAEDFGRGTLKRNGVSIAYAQHIKLASYVKLIPSVQFSVNRSTLDRGRLNFFDIIDPRYGIFWPPNNSFTTYVPIAKIEYADVAAGILLKFANYASVGASFSNLLEPNISHIGSYNLPVKTNLHANLKYTYNPRSYADIFLLSTFQNSYYNIRMNIISHMAYGITIGLGYGVNNSFWLYEGIKNTNQQTLRCFAGYSKSRFSILYSYDQYLRKNATGSHEISLQVLFKKKQSVKPSSIEDLN